MTQKCNMQGPDSDDLKMFKKITYKITEKNPEKWPKGEK
jgi:hypothetical protein